MFRSVVIAVELLLLLSVEVMLHLPLPLMDMLGVVGLYTLFNFLVWIRLSDANSAGELFLHLSVDVLVLTALFYYSGGSSNPFVSLFLLPLVIVATTLPRMYVWAMAILTLCCYSLLMMVYVPLYYDGVAVMHSYPGSSGSGFGMHVMGMWFSFLLGVGVILFFVATMAESIRERDKKLLEVREKLLRDEHVIALGTMAAGAAHELGTPLTTIAVVSREMEREYTGQPELLDHIAILRSQVERCKQALGQLSVSAGELRAMGGRSQEVASYVKTLLGAWQAEHPMTTVSLQLNDAVESPYMVVDETLNQAFINLLNNAAEASAERISVSVSCLGGVMELLIRDYGAGVNEVTKNELGRPFFSTKKQGMGLGFYLAQAVIARLGGDIVLVNHPEGGACVEVKLPLLGLQVEK
ncbi:MAG: ATP-binding protein [Mariprofundus sp.]|nr:ATP-binding protein [Mariprofundus sp.]